MTINFNGVNINPEQLKAQQEEAEKNVFNMYMDARDKFDCNYAIVNQICSPIGEVNTDVKCILDNESLLTPNKCQDCPAYNNKVYITD